MMSCRELVVFSVLAIASIAPLSAAAETVDAARANETRNAILNVATAWEAYASDANTYLPKNVGAGLVTRGKGPGNQIRWSNYVEVSYEALRRTLVPTYIRDLPRVDGWGGALQFAVHIVNSQGVEYVIRSLGSDSAEDNDGRYEPMATEGFVSDIVFADGEFKVYPSALTKPQTPPIEELNKLKPSDRIVALLEGSGLGYSKLKGDVWSTEFTGKHASSITLLIVIVDDTVTVLSKIAAKERLNLSRDTLSTLLRFNNDYDGVKAAIDDNTVWVRYDARVRAIDGSEWEYILNQVASGTDELVKLLKGAVKNAGT